MQSTWSQPPPPLPNPIFLIHKKLGFKTFDRRKFAPDTWNLRIPLWNQIHAKLKWLGNFEMSTVLFPSDVNRNFSFTCSYFPSKVHLNHTEEFLPQNNCFATNSNKRITVIGHNSFCTFFLVYDVFVWRENNSRKRQNIMLPKKIADLRVIT